MSVYLFNIFNESTSNDHITNILTWLETNLRFVLLDVQKVTTDRKISAMNKKLYG